MNLRARLNVLGGVVGVWLCTCQVVGQTCSGDLNNDGFVDGTDLAVILSGWGPCAPVPTLQSVSPVSGPIGGGTTITLTGIRLLGTTQVSVGGVPATGLQVINNTTVRVVTPAGSPGPKAVTVTTASGTSTLPNAFVHLPVAVPSWATLVEPYPNETVVTNASLRAAITASGYAWRVRHTASQIEMVLIPPGTVAGVTVTMPFYIGRYEVTQGQWLATMGSLPPNSPANLLLPVQVGGVTAVQQFVSPLDLRLPTEAEWEYAYRAGTTTLYHGFQGYPNGTDNPALASQIAWHSGNTSGQRNPVGQLLANGFGLHDMAGNVWEQVANWYGPPPSNCAQFKGGSWYWDTSRCTAMSGASCNSIGAAFDVSHGFRVARNP